MGRKKRKKSNSIVSGIAIIIVIGIGSYLIYNNLDDGEKVLDKNSEINKLSNEVEDNNNKEIDNDKKEDNISEEEQKKEQEEEKTEEYDFNTQDGEEEVKIEANKMVEATGFSGASNYKFYLRGTTLYFKDVSVSETDEEILAYNVKDLYLKNKEVVVELYSDGEIVKENNYITYK